ncbi:hypothetical protein IGI37_003377 [Enterococcus sp. AZ194]|uniref:hypothetical protein n=1 Tax=Enterococcus sp. AZ194 TaxID=2774629 RepID=UPI003F21BA07
MGKKKQFYDDYDALFLKKKVETSEISKQVGNSKAQPKKQQKTKASFSNTKKKKSVKEKQSAKHKISFRAVGCFVAIVVLTLVWQGYSKGQNNSNYKGIKTEYVDIYPLKDVGLERLKAIDLSNPLVATVDEKVIHFNKGYRIKITGDVDIEQKKDELSVLPTNKEYPNTLRIASLSFYEGRSFLRSVNIGMSGNLIESLKNYMNKADNKKAFTKAYPQEMIDDIQTGYVVQYEENSSYISLTLQRYFIFSDGTGVWLDMYTGSSDSIKLNKKDSFSEIKKAYPEDFKFLEDSLTFEKETDAAEKK